MWMNLKKKMRWERRKNKYHTISPICGLYKAEFWEAEYNGGCQGVRGGEWTDVGQRVHTSSYEANKFWGRHVQHGDNC